MSTVEITKALVKARIACNAIVRKDGKNAAQNYSYVGHEQVLVSGAREALLLNGLALVETAVKFLGEMKYSTRNGEQTCWQWLGEFLLLHESGERMPFEFVATTGPNDKAAFVASTALDRTAVLRICHLAGGAKEDPEHDSNERFEDAARRPQQVASVVQRPPAQESAKTPSQPPPANNAHAAPGQEDADPTEEQKTKIRSLAKTLGIQNQVQLSNLMKELVGKVAADITSVDAQTLIAKMGQRAIDKAEGRV